LAYNHLAIHGWHTTPRRRNSFNVSALAAGPLILSFIEAPGRRLQLRSRTPRGKRAVTFGGLYASFLYHRWHHPRSLKHASVTAAGGKGRNPLYLSGSSPCHSGPSSLAPRGARLPSNEQRTPGQGKRMTTHCARGIASYQGSGGFHVSVAMRLTCTLPNLPTRLGSLLLLHKTRKVTLHCAQNPAIRKPARLGKELEKPRGSVDRTEQKRAGYTNLYHTRELANTLLSLCKRFLTLR
jgi:hypothetical protein